jgi:hypothetical protein
VLFVIVVLFLPGGLTGTLARALGRRQPAVLADLEAR